MLSVAKRADDTHLLCFEGGGGGWRWADSAQVCSKRPDRPPPASSRSESWILLEELRTPTWMFYATIEPCWPSCEIITCKSSLHEARHTTLEMATSLQESLVTLSNSFNRKSWMKTHMSGATRVQRRGVARYQRCAFLLQKVILISEMLCFSIAIQGLYPPQKIHAVGPISRIRWYYWDVLDCEAAYINPGLPWMLLAFFKTPWTMVHSNPNGNKFLGSGIAFLVIATLAVALRLYTKTLTKAKWAADDWWICLSLVGFFAWIGIEFWGKI